MFKGYLYLKLIVLVCAITLTSCASVDEKHYMGAFTTPTPSNPSGLVNIFRVNIHGGAGMSNVRYIAGTYDERAVDFFLNEVKSDDYTPSDGKKFGKRLLNLSCPSTTTDGKPVSEADCKVAYENALKVSPLANNGTSSSFDSFVIIFSTNADAIAETFGAISENTIAVKSVNYLLHKDEFEKAAIIDSLEGLNNKQKLASVKTLASLLTDSYAANTASNDNAELNILRAVALGIAPERTANFRTIEEAKIWFASLD